MKGPLTSPARIVVIISLIYASAAFLSLPAQAVPPTSESLPGFTGFEAEPNDSTSTATPLTGPADQRVRGNILPGGDFDFYSFTASAGDRVYAATTTATSPVSSNTVLDLIGSDGTTVLESDNDDGSFGNQSSSLAGVAIPSSGTYFLKVRESAASTVQPYDLYVRTRSGTPTGETEPNDDLSPQTLPASGWVSGTVNPASDNDKFSFSMNAGDTAFISLDMDPERDTTTWNGRLGFAEISGSLLTVNDTNITSPNSETFFSTVKTADTYTVHVDEAGSGGGPLLTYQLSVSVVPAQATSCRVYTSSGPQAIPDNGAGAATSSISVPDDVRLARLAMDIDLDHPDMDDLDFVLQTPAGNELVVLADIFTSTTHMDLRLDDAGALAPQTFIVADQMLQPQVLAARLGWTAGEMTAGTWNLVIRDDTAGDTGTLNSWRLITCEAPPPVSGTTIYSSDFEGTDGGFTHSGTLDEWERGLPAFGAITSCASGTSCWKTDLNGTYDASSSQDLLSPPISLVGQTGSITLSWAQRYQMGTASSDDFFVDVREVGGGSPRRLFEWTGPHMTFPVDVPDITIQESGGWGTFEADISEYAGETIEIRFHLDSNVSVELAGLAIDDVRVLGPPVATPPTPPGTSPGPSVSVNGVKAKEGKPLKFPVVLSGAATQAVTVAYTTTAGSAKGGKDFTSSSGTLTFAPGETTEQIVVKTKNDRKDEKNEKLVVSLSGPSGATLGTAQGTGKIKDND